MENDMLSKDACRWDCGTVYAFVFDSTLLTCYAVFCVKTLHVHNVMAYNDRDILDVKNTCFRTFNAYFDLNWHSLYLTAEDLSVITTSGQSGNIYNGT